MSAPRHHGQSASGLFSLLNANILRSAASPLRRINPRVYQALNRVRQRILTRGVDVQAYQVTALRRFSSIVELQGTRILEVGSDLDLRVLQLLIKQGVTTAIGINNDGDFWSRQLGTALKLGTAELHCVDAANMPFEDESFDHVFSVSTFEHLGDLSTALEEMHRVLRAGGKVYTNFGPIWSSGRGHHVFAEVDGERAHHATPDQNPLPDHSHLLLTPDDMSAALSGLVSEPLARAIVDWVYRSSAINRLRFGDYLRTFGKSQFQLVSLKEERDPIPAELQRFLSFAFPVRQNLM